MDTVVVLWCFLSVTVAAPQLFGLREGLQGVPQDQSKPLQPFAIIRDERNQDLDGSFTYEYVSENGIVVSVAGSPGSRGQINMRGSYRFPFPDGTFAIVNFVADEAGYRAQSPLIPTPPPLPAHAREQIRVAEEQRARGITFL